ncbi:MAG: D-tyrosyl-tRNA(Tyr) deacylase [Ruminococcus sp.]|nr:D-tyrosyl-tRNA(Tyr) deacylase [Ruminococcus sp.]MDE6796586.1 D-tyrosyl-tRNA(Tyr) deacylase [Ruminococcus sp.]
MKIVLQRVTHASVKVDGTVTGKIDTGYLILFGAGKDDTQEDCRRLADKIINLRIFPDDNGKINLSLKDVKGSLLIVPQFTLYADCRKGNRPNFIQAGSPDSANSLFEYFTEYCRSKGQDVQTGIFGADMKVELLNDGPFTIILE